MGNDKVFYVGPGRLNWSAKRAFVTRGMAYEATATQAATPEEAVDTRALGAKFDGLDDRDLYVMAKDDEPVGPRIGVTNVPESTLKMSASYELVVRERKLKSRQWRISLGVTALIGVAGWIFAIFDLWACVK